MFTPAQSEHHWLSRLVGNWEFEHDCQMPDGSIHKMSGTMASRMLGELWLICESTSAAPDGSKWSSIMTVGFDPAKNQFVGTYVGSSMAMIWPYHGQLSPDSSTLPLESEGPKFDGSGFGKYRDTIKIIDENNWLFTSELQSDDGSWVQFMSGPYRRV